MDDFKRVIEGYVDLENVQLSKTAVAVGVGVVIIGRMIWDELRVRLSAPYQPEITDSVHPLGYLVQAHVRLCGLSTCLCTSHCLWSSIWVRIQV
jgi:hypothetical protein